MTEKNIAVGPDESHDVTFVDRRRPGRVEFTSPELISILRQEDTREMHRDRQLAKNHLNASIDPHDIRTSLCVASAIFLSLLLWLVCAVMSWFV
jgi:hypothetical protein